jgi:hypothetical protein
MKRLPAIDPMDVLALVALAAVAIGVGMVYVPAAFVVVGVVLLAYVYLTTRPTGGAS